VNRDLGTCLVAVGVLLAVTKTVQAQQRTVGGRVSNAVNEEPVGGATVSLVGAASAAVTDAKGQFSLPAPDGPLTLVVRAIGYKRRQVPVGPQQSSIAIRLDQDIFNLEAVVVTGQATGIEQRNLPQAVTVVNAQELQRAPASTIESALQGKIPGAQIEGNSGAPGGGAQISLRGVSTINGGVDPLLVVDGIVISNRAIGNNMNAISLAAAGGNASNQDNPVNRIADLNPADVENVTMLKGAAAAAIYGSQASNGVIVITTRRGSAGAPRFHMTQRFGQFRVSNFMTSRVFKDSTEAVTVYTDSTLVGQLCNLPNKACPNYDNIGLLWDRHPLSTETDASISGGTDQTRYFVSGLVKRDGGIAPNTGYDKQSVRANLDQVLSSRWGLELNSQVIHSFSQRGISNNDNSGTSPYLVFPLTPSFVDLREKNGVFPRNPFERSNPLQTYALLRNNEDVWRALGSAKLSWGALASEHQNLRFSATGGLDYFQQQNDIYSPPELQFEPNDGQPGTVVLGKASNLNLNLLVSGVHTLTTSSGTQATTSVGVQYIDQNFNFTNVVGRNLPPGQQNVDKATSININQDEQPQRDVGLFAQEEVLLMDQRANVTLGIRADRSSVNGDPNKYFFYPKAAVAYRLTDLGGNSANELKLRVALGQTGNPPVFGNKYVNSATATIGGFFGTFVPVLAGDPGIRPERQTELEGGVDGTLLNGRLQASVTLYNRSISDLLLVQTLAPSMGQGQRVFNGGKLRNRGIEIGAGYSIAQSPDLTWIVHSTFSENRSLVVELPVPAFLTGGFGTALGAYEIQQGKSATQIVGQEGVVGDGEPRFRMTFSSDLDYHRVSLGMTWDWKHGGDVINLTDLLFDLFGNSSDYNTGGKQRAAAFLGGKTQPYVQDASYLKLRELSLSYRLPARVTSQLFGSRVTDARVSLSGRNLLRFTKFHGNDPEVSNFGNQAIARNIDVAPFPPSRSMYVSVDFDF
jgi:TonB-linked SusC/RagA family outer membrane protein